MEEIIKKAALYVMSAECYDNYFLDYDFLDGTCFKALLSKALGFAIIGGSLLVKVPQVIKILSNRSGAGINLVGVFLDLMAITFQMTYGNMNGYPFSSWGDNTFLALQTATIAALVLYYGGAKGKSLAFCLGYLAFVYVLNSGLTPMEFLVTAQSCNIPILLVGKLSQAYTNYKNRSTGQLSAATVFMLFAGSLARIFTSIQETGDVMMVATFCASSFANGVIVAQLLYYWKKPSQGRSKVSTSTSASKKTKSKKAD